MANFDVNFVPAAFTPLAGQRADVNFIGQASANNLHINSIGVNPTSMTITFSQSVFLAGDALDPTKWVITPSGGAAAVSVIGVSAINEVVTLTITEATIGGAYTLNVPNGVLGISDGLPLIPPYAQDFSGSGVAPIVSSIIVSNDARAFDVVFSEAVLEAEAVLKANYNISPTLTISTVTKVQDNRYTVTTLEAQTPGQVYMVTVSNVHDFVGNLI